MRIITSSKIHDITIQDVTLIAKEMVNIYNNKCKNLLLREMEA